jgi:FKBP-type peptidyl-prolyl cis-trans isomerase
MNKLFAIAMIAGLTLLQACGSDDDTCTKTVPAEQLTSVDQARLTSDIAAIDAYLASKGIVAQTEPNGTRYVITTTGTGVTPCLENRVTVKYVGKLMASGNQFDASPNDITFVLSNLILGWKLVMPIVPVGSKVTLYIPSGYGYGSTVAAGGKIPSNSNLIFEIDFVGVR